MEKAVIEKLAKIYQIQAPQDQVENEIKRMTVGVFHQIKYQFIMSGNEVRLSEADMEELLEEIREEATVSVLERLVIAKVLETERFEISQEELESEAAAIAARQQTTVDMVKSFFGEDLSLLRRDLLEKKVSRSLSENVTAF